MFKLTMILWLVPLFLFAGEYEDHLKRGGGEGKYLMTWEDKKRLGQFVALFEMAKKREKPAGAIPKTLHFIWLGPKAFPQESVASVKQWIDSHAGWKVKFWTDYGKMAPDDRMEVSALDRFPLDEFKEYYYRSDNYGERSGILRYAILLSEGGVYVDHDVRCVKSIDELQEAYDFFCGMEPLGPTILSSSVNPSLHLLASTSQHPVLLASKKWLLEGWERLETQFPGNDPSAIYNRVQHRTFRALSVGFKEAHCRAGRKDVIFPPDYFSLADRKNALFAAHQHKGSWHQKESETEVKIQALFSAALQGVENNFLIALGLTAINLILGGFLAFKVFSRRAA